MTMNDRCETAFVVAGAPDIGNWQLGDAIELRTEKGYWPKWCAEAIRHSTRMHQIVCDTQKELTLP